MQGGWVEEHGCGSDCEKWALSDRWQVRRSYRCLHSFVKGKKKRTFGRSFSSVTLIAAVVCLPKLSLFIYRTVPHNELSNVLWTVNFPNAVVSFLYTCLQHTHTQPRNTPEVIIPRKLPWFYSVLKHQSTAFVWKKWVKEICFLWCPCILFEDVVKSNATAVTHQSGRDSQCCLQAQLIKQGCRTCQLTLMWPRSYSIHLCC